MRLSRIAAVTAAAAAMIVPFGVPAQAATPVWNIVNPNANGSFTGTGAVSAIKNPSGSLVISCPAVALTGVMPSGSNTSGYLGRLVSSNPPPCSDQAGGSWQLFIPSSMVGSSLHATGYDAAAGRTSFNGMTGNIFVVGPNCGFEIDTFSGTYTNATSTLATTSGHVRVGATSDGKPTCVGLLNDLDTITFASSFTLSPAITVTRS
ncbi:hypothetical protein [Actinomadura verrucosospora]|uniref:Secreted protein n=1 Tax=Actinomadura verrucosospora TaxID=46165 RepID=A0A7D4A1Y0_ACTVE|nr:hypothetical protein [Actinomadura verrucosospora]QKG18367.1 hypothetical protein ACTIVE_0001 [Actinomadura verrucosospora]